MLTMLTDSSLQEIRKKVSPLIKALQNEVFQQLFPNSFQISWFI